MDEVRGHGDARFDKSAAFHVVLGTSKTLVPLSLQDVLLRFCQEEPREAGWYVKTSERAAGSSVVWPTIPPRK